VTERWTVLRTSTVPLAALSPEAAGERRLVWQVGCAGPTVVAAVGHADGDVSPAIAAMCC
jgi:hypothetical protein